MIEMENTVFKYQIYSTPTGRLSYETALGLYAYLWKEIEYLPWSVAVGELQYINDMFKRTGGYGALKVIMIQCLTSIDR